MSDIIVIITLNWKFTLIIALKYTYGIYIKWPSKAYEIRKNMNPHGYLDGHILFP
jgi:hypothetical protein